jgi:hypothetical protein
LLQEVRKLQNITQELVLTRYEQLWRMRFELYVP